VLAVQVQNPGPVETHAVEEVPDLAAGPGQVLVDVKAAAVNYPDLLVVTGRYQTIPPLPFTPGKDAAGIVRAVGPGVKRVKPGDRVLLHVEYGTFATQALGQAAVQIASALGGTVLAAASNMERARSVLGETRCSIVDLSVLDLRDSLREQVHAATGGHGVNVVIETLGGDAFDAALRALAWCGRIVTVGFASGRIPEIKAGHLLVKNISALGLQWTDYRDRQPHRVARAHAALAALWQGGALRPQFIKTLPLRDFAEAFRLIDTRQANGRLVLTME
jgi:NADPH2:quinone reductase